MALSMSSAGAGGAALSTAAMAHQPNAMARVQAPNMPSGSSTAARVHAPSSGAALGADQIDKRLTRLARSTRHLPLMCMDVSGSGHVAYHPPVEGEHVASADTVAPFIVASLGAPLGSDLVLSTNDEKKYKAVRRYLTRGNGYSGVFENHPVTSARAVEDSNQNDVLVVSRPHSILGARRTEDLHPSLLSLYGALGSSTKTKCSTAAAIDAASSSTSVTLHDQALDGSQPKGDDYDRVSFHIPLHPDKKQLAVLPEEAVGLLLYKAKLLSYQDMQKKSKDAAAKPQEKKGKKGKRAHKESDTTEEAADEETYTSIPVAVAVPGYASNDGALESWMEILSNETTDTETASALIFPRSAAAVCSSLYSVFKDNTPYFSKLLKLTIAEAQSLAKAAQKEQLPDQGSHLDPLLVTVGMTQEGYEIAALQIASPRSKMSVDYPYGEYRYHHARCARFPAEMKQLGKLDLVASQLDALYEDLKGTLPGRKPYAVLVYPDPLQDMHSLEKTINVMQENEKLAPPVVLIREDAVSVGAVLLGAAACGRVDEPPVTVTSVSTTAVGVRISYFSENEEGKEHDGELKVIYDFDRRLPAGPYALDFSATECAAARANGGKVPADPNEMKKFEGAKGIPMREEAALKFTVQVVQQSERGGKWVAVGDLMKPLTYEKVKDDAKLDEEKEVIACESARLEIRMRGEGILASALENDG